MSKEMQYRNDGMAYALSVVKEQGIAGLEEEINYRNATMLPSAVQKKAIAEFLEDTKKSCFDTVLIMSLMVLRDEFDFEEEDITRFKKRFSLKSTCLADGDTNWKEMQDALLEETNVETKITKTHSIKLINE